MVTFSPSDVIPVADFSYAWRITDERWDKLPEPILARIKPLAKDRTEEIGLLALGFHAWGPHVSPNYKTLRTIVLTDDSPEGMSTINAWLVGLPITMSETVYVNWHAGSVVVTDWETFIKIWDSLFYPFDIVDVFDDTLAWAVMFGMEEIARYVEQDDVSSGLNIYNQHNHV